MFDKLKDNWRSVLLALALHVLVIVLLIFGVQLVSNSTSKGNHGQRIVEAAVANPQAVDTSMPEAVSPAADEKQPEPPPPEPKDSDAEKKAQAEAKQKAAERAAQKKAEAEAQRKARKKAREKAEAKRKAEEKAEAKRQAAAEAARKKAQAEREAKEKAEEAARKKAEAERKAKQEAQRKAREEARRKAREEAARRKAAAAQKAREQALKDAMAQESAGRRNAADDRALGRWIQAIGDKVEARWRRPPGANNISCNAQVTQLPNGSVTDVRLLGSCGSPAVDRSVEQAIRRSSPLPKAPSSDLFQKTINFHFEPDQ